MNIENKDDEVVRLLTILSGMDDKKEEISDAIYDLRCRCENPYNKDSFRVFYECLSKAAEAVQLNTRVEYMIRGDGNYKDYFTVVLPGYLDEDEIKEIKSLCGEDDEFAPGKVGLPNVYTPFGSEFEPWAEMIDIRPTTEAPDSDTHAYSFYEAFRKECACWKTLADKSE